MKCVLRNDGDDVWWVYRVDYVTDAKGDFIDGDDYETLILKEYKEENHVYLMRAQ